MKKEFLALLTGIMVLICTSASFSQSTKAPKYVSIAFIRSKSPDFMTMEKEFWVPVHQQLVKEGRKAAWYMYRVKYPTGTGISYDYIRFNVFTDWKQAEAPYAGLDEIIKKVHPNGGADISKKSGQTREVVWEQLFQVIDEAAIKIKQPSKYIVVNQMKSVAGSESEYVNLEITYFKPFHVERVARGVMTNWSLYKTAIPYGDKYEFDYMTLNGYPSWEDITKNNPPDVWSKVHGNLNFDEIHSKILSKRNTINNELWELVAFAVE